MLQLVTCNLEFPDFVIKCVIGKFINEVVVLGVFVQQELQQLCQLTTSDKTGLTMLLYNRQCVSKCKNLVNCVGKM